MNTFYFILGIIILCALDAVFEYRIWKPYKLGYNSAFVAGVVFTVLVMILNSLTA